MPTDGSQLPRHYVSMKERYPELSAAVEGVGIAARAAGPLDIKTGHLSNWLQQPAFVQKGLFTAIPDVPLRQEQHPKRFGMLLFCLRVP